MLMYAILKKKSYFVQIGKTCNVLTIYKWDITNNKSRLTQTAKKI